MGERPLEGRTPARDVTDDAGQRELGEFGGGYAAQLPSKRGIRGLAEYVAAGSNVLSQRAIAPVRVNAFGYLHPPQRPRSGSVWGVQCFPAQ
jgi:hypothetical protein